MSASKPASFTPYFTAADADQVRAAYIHAGTDAGYRSISELIEAAVLREVKRLQRRYNDGQPWPPEPAGAARPGRRRKSPGPGGDNDREARPDRMRHA